MAKRILNISIIEDSYHYIEVEKQPSGFFPHEPQTVTTPEALTAVCRKADEIHINAAFPSALYATELFPKVSKRYLNNLVGQDAHEKLHVPERLYVEFKPLEEVVDSGISKRQIAYIGLLEDEVVELWEQFKDFHGKIKNLTTLPAVLASSISQLDNPPENFIAVWVGETVTMVLISSSDGVVKVARNVPLGLSKGELSTDTGFLEQFTQELDKEISMTITFFKQQFREQVPKALYLVGNPHLEYLSETYNLPANGYETHYAPVSKEIQGIPAGKVGENLHLIGNLFLSPEFNFIPRKEIKARKVSLTFNAVYAFLAFIIVFGGIWVLRLANDETETLQKFNTKFGQLQTMQKQVVVLREDVSRLKPFEGWKTFYENTFKNQPPWNMFISEMALIVPTNIVIKNLQIKPQTEPGGQIFYGQMAGNIKAKNWQEGLGILRQFGGKLQSSSFFEVTNVQYEPESIEAETKTFDFQIAIKLLPGEKDHEI